MKMKGKEMRTGLMDYKEAMREARRTLESEKDRLTASHAGKREGQADGTDGEPGRVYENGGGSGGVAFASGGTE